MLQSLILLIEGAFREGTFEGRSRGGARARNHAFPAPGRTRAIDGGTFLRMDAD